MQKILYKNIQIDAGLKCLIILSMLYICIMLCNSIFTNRYITINDELFILGGTLTSPLTFILGDIIAEVYGYKIGKWTVCLGFFCQMLFALTCSMIINAPSPLFAKNNESFTLVFHSLPYIVLSSFLAYMLSGMLNIQIISRWKILLRGKYFWLRSIGASTIAEALYSFIAIIMMEIGAIPLNKVFKLIALSYAIKLIYSVIFAFPSNLIVNYLKSKTGFDIYDSISSYNPFKK